MEIRLGLIQKEPREKYVGLEVALKNNTYKLRGVQVGGFNGANESRGVQVGVINYAKRLRGLQIGMLVNYCGTDSVGVQIAPINIKQGNSWYSTLIPVFAIRTKKVKTYKNLEEKIA